jgi:hypothetical protein
MHILIQVAGSCLLNLHEPDHAYPQMLKMHDPATLIPIMPPVKPPLTIHLFTTYPPFTISHSITPYTSPTMPITLREVSPSPSFAFAPSSPTSQHGGSSTNPIEFILEKDQCMYGAHPLETERGKGLLKCRKCGKVVAESAAGEHVRMWSFIWLVSE